MPGMLLSSTSRLRQEARRAGFAGSRGSHPARSARFSGARRCARRISPFSSVSPLAAGDPDAAKGLLAEYCADRHALPDRETPATGLSAPSFTTIANDPADDPEERRRAFLQQHPLSQMMAFSLL